MVTISDMDSAPPLKSFNLSTVKASLNDSDSDSHQKIDKKIFDVSVQSANYLSKQVSSY
jgi:hypothetical protein